MRIMETESNQKNNYKREGLKVVYTFEINLRWFIKLQRILFYYYERLIDN